MIKRLMIKLIRYYQRMPLSTHRQCKFIPSCSEYAIDALEEYGVIKGSFKALTRILRCNPFNKGGLDPVIKEKRNS